MEKAFVDIVFGLISPDHGSIFIDDKKIEENNIFNYKIGYVSQNSYLLDDSVKNIAFGQMREIMKI